MSGQSLTPASILLNLRPTIEDCHTVWSNAMNRFINKCERSKSYTSYLFFKDFLNDTAFDLP